MYLLYSLALLILFVALLPYFIYQALRHGKYRDSFKERLGWPPVLNPGDGRKTIWVHAVSVGEFLAARPLVERIRRELPDWRLVVSTTTLTGQRLARAEEAARFDAVFYFPFDFLFAVRRSLNRVKPSLVVILETELWPNFLRECRKRGILTVIANGRISPRSFARYMRVRRFMAGALNDVSLLIMQSEADAERACLLGARAERVRACGNLKYDLESESIVSNLKSEVAQEIDDLFALSSSSHLLIAGSTAPGEEKILLAALSQVRKQQALSDARLLLAPRHPERFNEVASLIAQSGFRFARRSEAALDPRTADVILLDTIGELAALYRFAAVVFVGGSLVPRGGHNIIEPALYAKPIIVGPHTENFRQIVSDFAQANAVVQIKANGETLSSSFTRELTRLFCDTESAHALGARGREILRNSRGATECVTAAILEIIE